MHPPRGGGVSQDFKSSNRIKISRLVQILLHFYWFGAPHPQGGRGWVKWVSGRLGMMWGLSRRCLDDGDDTGMTWGRRGDNMETTGTTWGGDHGDHSHGDHIGTFWGYGDDTGRGGRHGDNVGTRGTMKSLKIII